MVKSKNELGRKFIVAAIQFCSNEDKAGNLKLAGKFIYNAVKNDADNTVFVVNYYI